MVVITQYLQGLYHPIWFGGSILCRSCKNFEKLESRSLDILGKKYRWQKGGCESITKIIGATGQISHIFHIYFTNLDFLGEIFRGPFWNPSKKCYLLIGGDLVDRTSWRLTSPSHKMPLSKSAPSARLGFDSLPMQNGPSNPGRNCR